MASQPSHRRDERGTLSLVVRLVIALALALLSLPTLNTAAFADEVTSDPAADTSTASEPVAEEPPAEPVTEEAPPAEEPPAEEPALEEPALEEILVSAEEPAPAPLAPTKKTSSTFSAQADVTPLVVAASFSGVDLLAADYIVADENGANDEPGQKDLTQFFGFTASDAGEVKIGWSWDEIAWSGNNTGDACALFDIDADGKADYAVCVTVTGSPATQLDTADNPSPRLYSCNDTRVDRCAGPTLISSGAESTVDCEVAQTSTDPFANGDAKPVDTSALCTIPLSLFSGGEAPQLINVCSYPSQEPNSDPSDCVLIPRDALLTVNKVVTPLAAADSTSFGFTFTGASAPLPFALLAGGTRTIPVRSGSALSLTEDTIAGWRLVSAACTNGQQPGELNLASGAEVTCTFTNTPRVSVTVTKAWVINSTSYTNANKPAGYSASLTLTGQTDPAFGTTYPGYSYGDSVTIGENVTVPPGCTNSVGAGDLGAKTLGAGDNTYTVTNTVTCAANVTVNKSWVINGTSYTNANKPAGYSATLTLTGQTNPTFGTKYTGYTEGDSVTVGESVSIPDGCTNNIGGSGFGAHTLAKGDNVYSITNTVTCGATVTVNKSWVINGTSYTNANKPDGYSATLTLTGQTNPTFGTKYTGYTEGASVTVDEDVTVPPGCTNSVGAGNLGVKTLAKGDNVYTVTNTVTCGATVTVNKSWVINGTSYTNGDKPDGYSATLTLTGQNNPAFGATYGGYVQGQSVTVGENVTVPPGCTNRTSGGGLGAHTLDKGDNVYTITNTVTCGATVTVNKSWVINGTNYTNANKPAGYSASLTLTGQTDPAFGTTYGDYTQGDSVTIGEDVTVPAGCTNSVGTGNLGAKTLGAGDNIFTVTNRVACGATVTVNKSWVINGTSYTNTGKPAGYSATLTLTGQTDPAFGTTYGDYTQGDLVSVGETVTVPTGCTNRASGVATHVLDKGDNVYTITNTVTCASTVTVNKSWVINGTSYTNANKPAGYSASLTLTGQTNPAFGTKYTGYTQGDSVTVGETVTVPSGCTNQASGGVLGAHTLDRGDNVYTITNTVNCPPVYNPPAWNLSKTSNPASGSTVEPGASVTYTLQAVNTSFGVVTGATVTDNLVDVLDNATLVSPLASGLSVTGTTLTWAVPTLQPGQSATVSYTVMVSPDQWNATLRNVVTPNGSGGSCTPVANCTTEHFTPAWELTKVSDPVSGTEVQPGDTITYTLTALNASDAVVEGALAEDDLSAVLNNATVDETSLDAGLSLSGTTLTWAIPTLQPGESASVSYTVTVDTDAFNVIIENVVVPVGAGGICVAAADCTTTHDTPEVLGEEVIKPRPPVVKGVALPATGAPENSGLFGLVGTLTVGLGALLMLADRRRRES